jgi:hypothetical protein
MITFVNIRKSLGIQKAPGPRGARLWLVYSIPGIRQMVKGRTSTALGFVQWSPGFRRYAFAPFAGVIMSEGCLREVAGFCATKTKGRRKR